MYMTLNPADNKLYCNASTIGNYQKFTLNNLCGAYSIKGYNNLYVSSEDGAVSGMTCTRVTPAGWEFFNWDIVGAVTLSNDVIENTSNKYQLFPNPVNNKLYINSSLDENLSIIVYDINGREVLNNIIAGEQKNMDVSALKSGVYFLKIIDSNNFEIHKFIKKED